MKRLLNSVAILVLFGSATALPLQAGTTAPLDWAQASTSVSPPARAFAAMDYDAANGATVLFGGSSNAGSADLADTWEWNGSNWLLMTPAVSPPAAVGAAMAYDSARSVSVLFGGSGAAGSLPSTWEWNGATWQERTPAAAPSTRVFAAMAYDSLHGCMVLFGGSASAGIVNDTWEYDGTTWTQLFPAAAPSPRYGAAMTFDPTRGRIVLFGGHDSSGRLGDTWEWDGTNWSQIATATAPSARFWSSMAFDAQRGTAVLFGGDHIEPYALGEENDTWEWDGSSWTEDWPAAAPSIRSGQTMAYDSGRARMVVFGGWNGTTTYGDTWELGTDIQTPAGSPNATFNVDGQGTDFGSVNVGSTSTNAAAFTVTSTGTGPLSISSIATTGDFQVSSSDCPIAPDVLASGAYCLTLVNFAPTAAGTRTGTLTISDNDPSGGLVVALQGTGVLIPTALVVTPAAALFNTTADFTATLTANGSPVTGEAVTFSLPTGATATFQTNAQGAATWAGASLSGLHVGTYPAGIQASFAGGQGYAASSASAALTVTQPVSTTYSGDYFVSDSSAAGLAVTIDQRTPASDKQFLDYGAVSVWARFTVSGPAGSADLYAPVADAPDWATSGLGVASVSAGTLPDAGYTVVATLVTASGSTTLSSAVAGDDVRVGIVSSPTKGGYLSGGGAIASDPSANTSDTHGYFSFQMKPASTLQGNLVYVYRVNMDVGGGSLRDVDVWVTSTDVTTLSGNGSSATATGHFSVEYVDAQTGHRYSAFEFSGGTYKLSAVNATSKTPAGLALVLKFPDGTIFHATAPVNPGGNAPVVPVVLGNLISNL